GEDVRYHADAEGPGMMSWQSALRASRAGQPFDAILRAAYPRAALAGIGSAADCDTLPEAAAWLVQRERRWRALLQGQPGFEPLAGELAVCRLAQGMP